MRRRRRNTSTRRDFIKQEFIFFAAAAVMRNVALCQEAKRHSIELVDFHTITDKAVFCQQPSLAAGRGDEVWLTMLEYQPSGDSQIGLYQNAASSLRWRKSQISRRKLVRMTGRRLPAARLKSRWRVGLPKAGMGICGLLHGPARRHFDGTFNSADCPATGETIRRRCWRRWIVVG